MLKPAGSRSAPRCGAAPDARCMERGHHILSASARRVQRRGGASRRGLFGEVIASIRTAHTETTRRAMRRVRTRVLPDPAPATTTRGRLVQDRFTLSRVQVRDKVCDRARHRLCAAPASSGSLRPPAPRSGPPERGQVPRRSLVGSPCAGARGGKDDIAPTLSRAGSLRGRNAAEVPISLPFDRPGLGRHVVDDAVPPRTSLMNGSDRSRRRRQRPVGRHGVSLVTARIDDGSVCALVAIHTTVPNAAEPRTTATAAFEPSRRISSTDLVAAAYSTRSDHLSEPPAREPRPRERLAPDISAAVPALADRADSSLNKSRSGSTRGGSSLREARELWCDCRRGVRRADSIRPGTGCLTVLASFSLRGRPLREADEQLADDFRFLFGVRQKASMKNRSRLTCSL